MRNLRRGWVQARIAGRRRPRQVVRIALDAVLRSHLPAADTGAVAGSALLYVGRRVRNGAIATDERAIFPDSP